MRHFRNAAEIEAFMAEEYRRHGMTVADVNGTAVVVSSKGDGEEGNPLAVFPIAPMAQKLWEAYS